MKINKGIILISVGLLLLVSINIAFSKEGENIIEGPPLQQIVPEAEMQWVWGEVVLIDPANKKIVLKYLDYETDSEKEIIISVNELTRYDNLVSFDQLKPMDTISVDYIITLEGINLARNISIEKPEEAAAIPQMVPIDPQAMPNPEAPAIMQEETPPPEEPEQKP